MAEDEHEIGADTRSVLRLGRSVAVTLPKEFVDAHGIKVGDKIHVEYDSFLLLDPKHQDKILESMGKKKKEMYQKTPKTEE